jgi:hypothetical protein
VTQTNNFQYQNQFIDTENIPLGDQTKNAYIKDKLNSRCIGFSEYTWFTSLLSFTTNWPQVLSIMLYKPQKTVYDYRKYRLPDQDLMDCWWKNISGLRVMKLLSNNFILILQNHPIRTLLALDKVFWFAIFRVRVQKVST